MILKNYIIVIAMLLMNENLFMILEVKYEIIILLMLNDLKE